MAAPTTTPPGRAAMRRATALLAYGLLASPWAVAAQCLAEATTTVTTVPEVRRGHDIRFSDRLAVIEAGSAGPAADVLVLGDSIIQQWPKHMLEQVFPGRRVLNAGVAGDGSAALLHRLESLRIPAMVDGQRVELGVGGWERQRPAEVVVLIGTNDLRRASACDVALGALAVVDQTRRLYPAARVSVIGILPRGADQTELAGAIAVVNRHLAERAIAASFVFVDAHAVLLCPAPAEAPCGMARPPNHVHLTSAGYGKLGDALRQPLARRQP